MKKSLIALAALAAVGAASAQSSVTLYGVLDAGYTWTQHTAKVPGTTFKTTETGFTSGNLSGSRWGMKGQEDLGNGLAAVFNVEAGFNSVNGRTGVSVDATDPDNATGWGNGFNRRSVVGLKGSFGQVVVGRDYTPIDDLASGKYQAIDSFSYDNLGGYYVPGPALYTDRYNGIHYTGEFSGVSVKAFAGYDEYKEESNSTLIDKVKGHGVGLGLGYASGAFSIDGAVQHFDQGLLGGNKNTEFAVAASYDFGPAKLMGHYIGNKIQDFPTFQQFGLGVTAPFGAATLGAQYAYNRGKTTGGMGDHTITGHDFGVIANYALSKRTDLYARAMRSNSWKVLNDKDYSDSVTVGIRHRF